MANSTLFIDGLDHNTADAGLPISSLPVILGLKGIVTDFSIIWGGDGLPPSDGAISLQGFPYPGAGAIATGTDSSGGIGVVKTFAMAAPFDDDTQWDTSAGLVVLTDGFWDQDVRVFISNITGTRRVQIDIVVLELSDLTENLVDTPDNLVDSNPSWDLVEEEGSVDLDWTYDNTLAEDPAGFAIVREKTDAPTEALQIVGNVPFETGVTDYSYTDYFFLVGTYSYYIITYKYGSPPEKSPPSSPPIVIVIGGDSPDISVTSDMGFTLEWGSVMAFITDPSGIYGLIPNKTHDTLYNRAVETSIDVKIPDPFVKLAFLPEE